MDQIKEHLKHELLYWKLIVEQLKTFFNNCGVIREQLGSNWGAIGNRGKFSDFSFFLIKKVVVNFIICAFV
jgi:hypothetical protein